MSDRLHAFRFQAVAWAAAIVAVVSGASARPKSPARKVERPQHAWLSAKGFCCFPLADDELPPTGRQLSDSMLEGWKEVFVLPDPARVIDIRGGRYPAIDSMHIDLTRAVVNPQRPPASVSDRLAPTPLSVSVRRFALVAAPMINHKAQFNVEFTGRHVRLDVQHDREGNPLLELADAEEGTLRFDVSHDDLERMLLASLKEQAARHALTVRAVDLDLRSVGPRSISCDLHISALVGFIPAGMRFTSRVDIDDHMNARISHLSCDGDDVLGPLIVGLIRPGIARYNNTTRPLLSFPSPDIHLKRVELRAGQRIEMNAVFGR